jgi:hypothetical protein
MMQQMIAVVEHERSEHLGIKVKTMAWVKAGHPVEGAGLAKKA